MCERVCTVQQIYINGVFEVYTSVNLPCTTMFYLHIHVHTIYIFHNSVHTDKYMDGVLHAASVNSKILSQG